MTDFTPSDYAASKGRFCDIVMKGGVTSGIVYPPAICALASQYDVRCIGGTSVGAIAAAIAAAAEYRRRVHKSGEGYVLLSKLPKFLQQEYVLLRLFAADPAKSVSLLRIALRWIGARPLWLRAFGALWGSIVTYWWLVVPAMLLLGVALATASAAAFHWPAGDHWLSRAWNVLAYVAIPLAIWTFAFVALPPFAFAVHCVTVLAGNDFGWCHAYDAREAQRFARDLANMPQGKDVADLAVAQTPRLFDWLDVFVAQTAGRDRADPLTFGDLRRADVPPWYEPEYGAQTNPGPSIDFRMVTTCLTLGRPFRIPFDPGDTLMLQWDNDFKPGARNLYFLKSDFEKYFPPGIVAHMISHGELDAKKTYRVNGVDEPMYRFPDNDDLPVLVGVRFSMCFPVLFCAIRLFTPDPRKPTTMRPLWFTDGGLSSNFPIHLFDNPLPSWPTFGLDLLGGGMMPIADDDTFIEYDQRYTAVESQHEFETGKSIERVLEVASAMIDAMRNWQDAVLGGLPGNSSRTIGVRLPEAEGGINLNMRVEQVEDLTNRGERAGRVMVENFVAPSGTETPAWLRQRWLRYLAAMSSTINWLDALKHAAAKSQGMPGVPSYVDLAASNYAQPPPAPTPTLLPQFPNEATSDAAVTTTRMLQDISLAQGVGEMITAVAPPPVGELHIRPPA